MVDNTAEEAAATSRLSPLERSGWKMLTFVAGWILFVLGIFQGTGEQGVSITQLASIVMGAALMFLSIFAWLRGQPPASP